MWATLGCSGLPPFITDSSTEIPLPNGAALKTATAAKQKTEMQAMMQQGNLGRYSAVLYHLQPASDGGQKGTPAAQLSTENGP